MLGDDLLDRRALTVEIVKPMRETCITLADNEGGLSGNLTAKRAMKPLKNRISRAKAHGDGFDARHTKY